MSEKHHYSPQDDYNRAGLPQYPASSQQGNTSSQYYNRPPAPQQYNQQYATQNRHYGGQPPPQSYGQPVYVQKKPPSSDSSSCLAACLAALCLCYCCDALC
ncbi:uncharacterized protein ASCRUDRAFT_69257 [Ascoidea rubescens DSM 1968]|uniref:Cysteine-rich transmembrane domain-containing protein n=1 Tax=Ascoidea rubescens DSM 1968 TaxID=1344418 RepID=A0A1D2VLJ0_9ASCO|nr:hypothetical protein ASCRUDRAFT_69257 [Ascoidea rubescens DSM 1968]ODV62454.1 hypothetical protein ASCRUDRAFT_69257 [Ascoidea rubescens DSM 1968]